MNHREKIPGSVQSTWPEFPAAPPHGERANGCKSRRVPGISYQKLGIPGICATRDDFFSLHIPTSGSPQKRWCSAKLRILKCGSPTNKGFPGDVDIFWNWALVGQGNLQTAHIQILKKSLFGLPNHSTARQYIAPDNYLEHWFWNSKTCSK